MKNEKIAFLTKVDEALYIQNLVAAEDGMNIIRAMYGPFSKEEIDFYKERLKDGISLCRINSFQGGLIFNLFYKFFGDPQTINSIDLEDYVTLIIAARRILESSGMVLLPYIISAKVNRLAVRKTVNKKELLRIESSSLYASLKEKYRNEKVEKHVLGLIATTLSSEFEVIDPDDPEVDGCKINVLPEIIGEELMMYVGLI